MPIIGVYAYYKTHKLVINRREVKLDNLEKYVKIVRLCDVHFGAVRYRNIIVQLNDTLNELKIAVMWLSFQRIWLTVLLWFHWGTDSEVIVLKLKKN